MQEKTTNEFEEETIHLDELEGEELQVDLQQLEQNSAGFQKTLIQAPDHMTFRDLGYLKTVDGFTPGAIKNIFNISPKRLRVYKVTEEEIALISCSEIPDEIGQQIFTSEFTVWRNLVFNRKTPTIQVISGENNKSINFQLNPKNGKLVSSEEENYSNIDKVCYLKSFGELRPPKNSKIDFYVNSSNGVQDQSTWWSLFLRQRGNRGRKWLDHGRLIKKMFTKALIRLKAQTQALNSNAFRRILGFQQILNIKVFEYQSPGISIVRYMTDSVIFLSLINFRKRKIIKNISFSLLDILTLEQIYGALQAAGGNEEAETQVFIQRMKFSLRDIIYEKESDSLILDCSVVRAQKQLVIKVTDPFNFPNLKENSLIKMLENKANNKLLLGKFSPGRLLCYSNETATTTYARPLAFLSTSDLSLKKIMRLDENKILPGTKGGETNSRITRIPLCRNKMLIVTRVFALIYDYERGEVVDQFRHTLAFRKGLEFKQIDDLIVYSHKNKCSIIKTGVRDSDSGEREFKGVKTIYYNDIFPDLSPFHESSLAGFYKLSNGNYIIFSPLYFSDANRYNRSDPVSEHGAIQINSESFEVVKSTRRDISQQANLRSNSSIYLVNGFLVFLTRSRTDRNSSSFLTLATMEFDILDQSKQARLPKYTKHLAMISGDRIATPGRNGGIFMHQVDRASKRLLLLRRVKFQGGYIVFDDVLSSNRSHISCHAKVTASQERGRRRPETGENLSLILNFDKDLKLVSYIHQQGLSDQRCVFSVSKDGILLSSADRNSNHCSMIYHLNLMTREVRYVHRTKPLHMNTRYQVDDHGDVYFVEPLDESILILKLN